MSLVPMGSRVLISDFPAITISLFPTSPEPSPVPVGAAAAASPASADAAAWVLPSSPEFPQALSASTAAAASAAIAFHLFFFIFVEPPFFVIPIGAAGNGRAQIPLGSRFPTAPEFSPFNSDIYRTSPSSPASCGSCGWAFRIWTVHGFPHGTGTVLHLPRNT